MPTINGQFTDANGNIIGLFAPGASLMIDGSSSAASYVNNTGADVLVRAIGIGSTTTISLVGTADGDSMFWPDELVDYIVIPKGATLSVQGGKLQITFLR
jgi:hypothetical protein